MMGRPVSRSTPSRYPRCRKGSGGPPNAASVGGSLVAGGEKRRSASSNDASDAASAAADASAAASTALRSIWLGITRGDGWGAFTSSLGPLWGVTTGSSSEEGDHASGTRGEGGRSRSPDEPRRPSARSTDRRRSTGDATPARAHAPRRAHLLRGPTRGDARVCRRAGPACLFSLPLGGGVRRRRAEGDARFSGARVEEARRGRQISVRQPRRRRDATRPPRRIAVAGPRPPVTGRRPPLLRGRVAVCVHPARGSCFERYKPVPSSRTPWAVSAELSAFLRPNERRKPGANLAYLSDFIRTADLSGRSTAVGWRLEPTRCAALRRLSQHAR